MKKLFATVFLFIAALSGASLLQAQAIYKNDPGYFGSIKSLYLRGGSVESAQLIGPAFGYRFSKTYDAAFHTEFLFSEVKFSDRENGHTSLLNLGITLGRTTHLSDPLMVRSELSLYKSFNFNVEGFPQFSDPSLTSGQFSSSLYASLQVSDTITLLPNAGGFIGYGAYDRPVSDAELSQGFDGFVAGPQLGLDLLFTFSDSFYLAVTPTNRSYFVSDNNLEGEFKLDFRFNF